MPYSLYEVIFLFNSHSMAVLEIKCFPTLQPDIAAASIEALEGFDDKSRMTVLHLVEQKSSYLTVEFFRNLQAEPEKKSKPVSSKFRKMRTC